MTQEHFKRLIQKAPLAVRTAWHAIHQQPRSLFDPMSTEWNEISMGARLEMLDLLGGARLIDPLLGAYLATYRTRNTHVLNGLGHAVMEYADRGYDLRIPERPFIGPRHHGIYVAAMGRLFGDNTIDRTNFMWLIREVERLQIAVAAWLTACEEALDLDSTETNNGPANHA